MVLFLYDSSRAARRDKKLAERGAGATGTGRQLLCARCGHPVTRHGERIEVDGAHEHRRVNPAGYAWRIANCTSCLGHLGWRDEAGADGFFGLILERLAEQN